MLNVLIGNDKLWQLKDITDCHRESVKVKFLQLPFIHSLNKHFLFPLPTPYSIRHGSYKPGQHVNSPCPQGHPHSCIQVRNCDGREKCSQLWAPVSLKPGFEGGAEFEDIEQGGSKFRGRGGTIWDKCRKSLHSSSLTKCYHVQEREFMGAEPGDRGFWTRFCHMGWKEASWGCDHAVKRVQ